MSAQLVALDDGPNILLDKPILLLGRHPECDVQIESRKISRRHCCIARVDDSFVVRDLGSTNGVRINGKRVAEGPLVDGDELVVGDLRYTVRNPEQSSTVAPLPPTPQVAIRPILPDRLELAPSDGFPVSPAKSQPPA
jgi:pSer/pThr/pTyr-binding forkhead associated (FHA) protein